MTTGEEVAAECLLDEVAYYPPHPLASSSSQEPRSSHPRNDMQLMGFIEPTGSSSMHGNTSAPVHRQGVFTFHPGSHPPGSLPAGRDDAARGNGTMARRGSRGAGRARGRGPAEAGAAGQGRGAAGHSSLPLPHNEAQHLTMGMGHMQTIDEELRVSIGRGYAGNVPQQGPPIYPRNPAYEDFLPHPEAVVADPFDVWLIDQSDLLPSSSSSAQQPDCVPGMSMLHQRTF